MAYVQHTEADIERMLDVIGADSVDALFRSIPSELRLRRPLDIPELRTESEITRRYEELGSRNSRLDAMPSFLGAGVYRRFIPAAVDALSSRGELNTAYTPYQPEVSQGTLQIVFEYQTLVARLTGMEISNASMYEAGTALVEAVLMAYTIRGKGARVLVSEGLHPEYRRVLETYFNHHPIELETLPLGPDGRIDANALESRASTEGVIACVMQTPNFFGVIEDGRALRASIDAAAERGDVAQPAFFVAAVDPVSLGVLAAPGEYGVDVAVGDGQALGNDPNLGGPTFGFFATRTAHVRKIPGRIVGETRDADGKRGYVLTFQTREQHIRRERATSNICTNQGLCCLRGAIALALLGESGIQRVAELSTRMAHHAAARLLEIPGVRRVFDGPFFHEFALELPRPAREVYRLLLERGVRGGLALDRFFPDRSHQMLFATTELTTVEDVDALTRALGAICEGGASR